ncbi:MAG: hypothetical protein KY441_08885, partial [Actinobacteria bacterium]|nr:hypothetical protein [Actinomycetota bacterium]
MGMYAVDTASSADLAELGDAPRAGRAVAVTRRRQLAQGKQALNGAGAAENLSGNGAEAPPAASNGQPNGQGAPSGAQGAPGGTAVATNGVSEAEFGRAVSKQRRRQLAQGKQALNGAGAAENVSGNGAGAPPAASNGQPNGQGAPSG